MFKIFRVVSILVPGGLSWRKLLFAALGVGLLIGAFYCGRFVAPQKASATDSNPRDLLNINARPVARPAPGNPVAYVFRDYSITRQDLGEYLVLRLGAQRLNFMVNRKIIEIECQKRGIQVTDTEVDEQLVKDLQAMNIPNLEGFVKTVLTRFGKSLYEYKEDVIRPKLALRKLCEGRVKVTYQDIQNAFEAKYGPKVQCRMIVFPKEQPDRTNMEVWQKISRSETEFAQYARKQNIPELAAQGGQVPLIHKHFPDKNIEKIAFSLKPGDVSQIIAMPDGSKIVLKCDNLIDPITNRQIKNEMVALRREVHEQKLLQEMPKFFNTLKKQANPNVVLHSEKLDEAVKNRINFALNQAAQQRYKNLPRPPHKKIQPVGHQQPLPPLPNNGGQLGPARPKELPPMPPPGANTPPADLPALPARVGGGK